MKIAKEIENKLEVIVGLPVKLYLNKGEKKVYHLFSIIQLLCCGSYGGLRSRVLEEDYLKVIQVNFTTQKYQCRSKT